ncbi:MAG: DUF2779 domain-containing protein [Candidatus Woesearchaeota archaeon]
MKILTKSKYMIGLESKALLWRVVNEPEKTPNPDFILQDRFDEGALVESYARKYFGEGVDLSNLEFEENLEMTKKHLELEDTVFEAGFLENRCFARADVISPNEDGFDLFEVKSSTSTKKEHVEDLAFQKFVIESKGYKVKRCFLIHLNKNYYMKGKLDLKELFVRVDLTEEVEKVLDVKERVHEMLNIIDLEKRPEFDVLEVANSKHENEFVDEFLKSLPKGNVFELYSIGKAKAVELYKKGIVEMKDLPADFKLNSKQLVQVKSQRETQVNKDKIEKWKDEFEEPLIYLDFETFTNPIPLFEGTKPYMHIPFQYSIHIESDKGLIHKEFLYEKEDDPRRAFITNLLNDLPKKGSIIVYYKTFEVSRLKELAKEFPELKEEIKKVILRVKDLRDPFSNFWYHNKRQKGSNSIKNVLPIFSDESYKDLEVSDGRAAMIIYKNNRGKLSEIQRKDLLEYCKLDTMAMVIILRELKKLVSTSET